MRKKLRNADAVAAARFAGLELFQAAIPINDQFLGGTNMVAHRRLTKEKALEIIEEYITEELFNGTLKGKENDSLYKGFPYDPHTVEIKRGNSFEYIYSDISKFCHIANDPKCITNHDRPSGYIILGYGVTEKEARDYCEKHKIKRPFTILAKIKKSSIDRLIANWYSRIQGLGTKINHSLMFQMNQDIMEKIIPEPKIYEHAVDYYRVDKGIHTIIEIKTTFRTDSSKTPAEIRDKMIRPFICLGNVNKQAFCAAVKPLDHKSPLFNHLAPEMVKHGASLFDFISTTGGISFPEFSVMFEDRLEKVKEKYLEKYNVLTKEIQFPN